MPNDDTMDSTDQQPQGDVQTQSDQPQGDQPAVNPVETPDEPEQGEEKPDIDWRAMSRKHEDRWKALSAENDNLKKQLEAANTAAGRVSDLEAAVSAAEKRAERAEIAAEVSASKGVKLRYLSGETREELEAAADAWLEDAKAVNSRIGVVPTQGTGDPAPRVSSYESGVERARARRAQQTKEGL